MKCGYLWFFLFSFFYFLFSMLSFLGCLPLFFGGYFGCMALWVPPGDYDREGFLNAIETWVPNSKKKRTDSAALVIDVSREN